MKRTKNFIVNEEAGLVVAEMDRNIDFLKEITNEKIKSISALISTLEKVDFCSSNNKFKSLAKTIDGDEFDEVVGKDIAGMKVDYKYHRYMNNCYKKVEKILEKMLNEVGASRDFHLTKMSNIENDMVRYLGGETNEEG